MRRHPEYPLSHLSDRIVKQLRESLGLEACDTSSDQDIHEMSPEQQWEDYLHYEGIIGYSNLLDQTHRSIFGEPI